MKTMQILLYIWVIVGISSGQPITVSDSPLVLESDKEIIYFDYTLTGSSIENTDFDAHIVYNDSTVLYFSSDDVSVNWYTVEIARTNDVFIRGYKVPEYLENITVYILEFIYYTHNNLRELVQETT